MLPYDEAGQGRPLVLLHAGICDRSMWAEHLEPLAAAGHRVVAFDMPGFGEAEIEPGDQASWLDVLGAMDELGLGEAAIVGNSLGGGVALRIAAVAPNRVTGLGLISAAAPGIQPSPQLQAAWAAEERALESGDVDGAIEAVLNAWTLPDAPATLRDRIAVMQRRAFAHWAEAGQVNEAFDPVEEDPAILEGLEMPALVAVGERDMPDFREGAETLGHTLPNARLEIIEGAGHLGPLETPERFRELLLAWLS